MKGNLLGNAIVIDFLFEAKSQISEDCLLQGVSGIRVNK